MRILIHSTEDNENLVSDQVHMRDPGRGLYVSEAWELDNCPHLDHRPLSTLRRCDSPTYSYASPFFSTITLSSIWLRQNDPALPSRGNEGNRASNEKRQNLLGLARTPEEDIRTMARRESLPKQSLRPTPMKLFFNVSVGEEGGEGEEAEGGWWPVWEWRESFCKRAKLHQFRSRGHAEGLLRPGVFGYCRLPLIEE
ncbi:unnamed protein product [Fusarium equiseti]|uniref:Uncharacterized protein n=1 Tax=Fusarium equiseti TaxID=61235 RepID=A0A8J2NPM2_FUSEQ|nr:unnamed protein product [Fusarium equiseti]